MFVLRLDYLQVTGGQDVLSSAIEAAALTAVSAALVVVGFVVLSHRTPKAVANAERIARETANSGAVRAAAAARTKAARSRAALEDTVVTWVVSPSPRASATSSFSRPPVRPSTSCSAASQLVPRPARGGAPALPTRDSAVPLWRNT